MTTQPGAIALVGSGEYLPVMAELESELLAAGSGRVGGNRFVQLPTAAGREGADRLAYWRRLGGQQAGRIGAEQVFLPVYDRAEADNPEFADALSGAALIYLSGGDPGYLAETLRGSLVGEALLSAWRAGSSLAGCSAGAMALGRTVPHVRGLPQDRRLGLEAVPHIQTIPHYDRFLGWMPDRVMSWVVAAEPGVQVVGIDEDTAMVANGEGGWRVYGKGKVHRLHGGSPSSYAAGEVVDI